MGDSGDSGGSDCEIVEETSRNENGKRTRNGAVTRPSKRQRVDNVPQFKLGPHNTKIYCVVEDMDTEYFDLIDKKKSVQHLYFQPWDLSMASTNNLNSIVEHFDHFNGTLEEKLHDMVRYMNMGLGLLEVDKKLQVVEIRRTFEMSKVLGRIEGTVLQYHNYSTWKEIKKNCYMALTLDRRCITPEVLEKLHFYTSSKAIVLPKSLSQKGKPGRKKKNADPEDENIVEFEQNDTGDVVIRINPFYVWYSSSWRRMISFSCRIPLPFAALNHLEDYYMPSTLNIWLGWRLRNHKPAYTTLVDFVTCSNFTFAGKRELLDRLELYPDDPFNRLLLVREYMADNNDALQWRNVMHKTWRGGSLGARLQTVFKAIKFHYGEDDEEKTQLFMDFICNILTNPNDRAKWVWVNVGGHGSGKSWFFREFLIEVMGVDNAAMVSNKNDAFGQFNALGVNKSFLAVEEGTIRGEFIDDFKVFITEYYNRVRLMHNDPKLTPNDCNVIINTNNLVADPNGQKTGIENGERRLCCMESREKYSRVENPKEYKKYWDEIYSALKDNNGECISLLFMYFIIIHKISDDFDTNNAPKFGVDGLKKLCTRFNTVSEWLLRCCQRRFWFDPTYIKFRDRPYLPKEGVLVLLDHLYTQKGKTILREDFDHDGDEYDDFTEFMIREDVLYEDYKTFVTKAYAASAVKNRINWLKDLRSWFKDQNLIVLSMADIQGPEKQDMAVMAKFPEYKQWIKQQRLTTTFLVMPSKLHVQRVLGEQAGGKEIEIRTDPIPEHVEKLMYQATKKIIEETQEYYGFDPNEQINED